MRDVRVLLDSLRGPPHHSAANLEDALPAARSNPQLAAQSKPFDRAAAAAAAAQPSQRQTGRTLHSLGVIAAAGASGALLAGGGTGGGSGGVGEGADSCMREFAQLKQQLRGDGARLSEQVAAAKALLRERLGRVNE